MIVAPKENIGYKYYTAPLVRSAIPGALGELYFSSNEDLLHALGLNAIQQSKESKFAVTVCDAYTDNMANSPQAELQETEYINTIGNGYAVTGKPVAAKCAVAELDSDGERGIDSLCV
ncbi:hypothetical protein AGMMS50276_08080 [Synergistales bacterium]|nr:hypothetical protein AGMMS50276_08080 [Synergistales bacterium]